MPFERLTKETARAAMAELVSDYKRHSTELESPGSRYTELEARSEYIDRFLRILGWDIGNEDSKPQVTRDVVLERMMSESDLGGRPDYRLRVQGRDRIPVEAKKPSVRLSAAAAPARQARSYGWSLSLPASVLTNVAETVIFDTTIEPADGDSPDVAVVPGGRFSVDEYVSRFDDLWERLAYDRVASPTYFDQYSYVEPPRGTSPFDRTFLREFRRWRLMLAGDVATNNPSLSAVEVGRRTQLLLNALLFLRVCEDRHIGAYEGLLQSAENDELVAAFRSADRAFNAGLFDVLRTTTCGSAVLASVVREMYWPRSKFAFGVLRPDILAAVYEQYLGERVDLGPSRQVTLVPKPELTHAGGITPTPGWVVADLVEGGLEGLLPTGEPVPEAFRALDLSMGSGPFLIEVLERMIEVEERAGKAVGLAERASLLKNHLYGVDIDAAAVEVAKLSLLLAVLGDDPIDATQARALLPDLSSNLRAGNALVESDFDTIVPVAAALPERRACVAPLALKGHFQAVLDAGGFDLIVGNPPFVRIQVLSEYMPDQLAYFQDPRSGYLSAQAYNFDYYQLFVERAFQLLSPHGRLAYILPNRFTNLLPAATMRGLLGPRLKRLVHFGDQQVFENRMTYTALVFCGPKTQAPAIFEIVSDLEHWRAAGVAPTSVDRASLTEEPWPVANESRAKVFEKMQDAGVARLGDTDWLEIFVGVQTSADDIFFVTPDPSRSCDEYARFTDAMGVSREVEWAILRPAIRDQRLEPWGRDPVPDAYVIFPYEILPPTQGRKRGKAVVHSPAKMRSLFPRALEYLTARKAKLQERSVSPKPGEAFWAYGRSQSLTKLDEAKLIIRVLSRAPQYVLDMEGLVTPGGGDGGPYYLARPSAECPYSITVLQALLSHPAVDAFVAAQGRSYKGGYVVHRKAFMESVPVPDLDDEDQKRIHDYVSEMQDIVVRLRDEEDHALRASLTGRFHVLRQLAESVISQAYGLTSEDMSAIVGD